MHQKNKLPSFLFHLIFIIGLLIFLNSANGQQLNVPQTFGLRKFTQDDGLSGYNVRKIIIDNKGFIWAATIEGLNRFNGKDFKVFNNKSKPPFRIEGTDVSDICFDKDKERLWVLPSEKFLHCINTITSNVIKTIAIPEYKPTQWNTAILNSAQGIWIGTSNGLFFYNTSKESFVSDDPFYADNYIEQLEIFDDSTLLIGLRGGSIELFDYKKERTVGHLNLTQPKDVDGNFFFRRVQVLPNKNVLIASSKGILECKSGKDNQLTFVTNSQYALDGLFFDIKIAHSGSLVCAGSSGVYRFVESKWMQIEVERNSEKEQWLNQVNMLVEDSLGNLWLACQQGIAFIPDQPSAFHAFTSNYENGLNLPHVRSLFVDGETIYAGLRNGLVSIQNAKWNRENAGGTVYHIFRDYHNLLHVSSSNGWLIKDGKNYIPIQNKYPELASWKNIHFNSHLFIDDSIVVIGSENDNGVLIWDSKHHTVQQISATGDIPLLNSNTVNNIFQDSKGRIWVLSDNTFAILERSFKKLIIFNHQFLRDSIGYNLFFDMCEIGDEFFLASYGQGIIVLDKSLNFKRKIDKSKGLTNEGVYQVFALPNNYLLVTTNNGISVINTTNDGIYNYYERDGLHGNAFEEVAGIKYRDLILSGGLNGFSVIEANRMLPKTMIPKLYWERASVLYSDVETMLDGIDLEKIEINPAALQTRISFIGMAPTYPSTFEYTYRINGIQDDWVFNGHQNFVTLTGIDPGDYTLQVKARMESGKWSEPISMEINFVPYWYQTYWFKIILLFTIASIFYGLYRYRLYQIRKENNIRTRIAADLHDDLGSTLTGIKVYSELGASTGSPEYYIPVKQGLQEASLALREMIWVLDTKTNTLSAIIEKLGKNVRPLLQASRIDLIMQTDAALETITCKTDEKRDVYLLLKEFINNSIKYAACSNITIYAKVKGKRMQLEISDNGKGFDVAKVQRGNGLGNIELRAKRSGYDAAIISSAGNGTTLRLTPF